LDTQPVPHPVRDISLGSHQSYDLLPGRIQEKIVAKLVELKRLAPPLDLGLPFLAAHYAGITHPNDSDAAFHRFFVRSHITSRAGTFVYNTEALVSDDGTTVHVRELRRVASRAPIRGQRRRYFRSSDSSAALTAVMSALSFVASEVRSRTASYSQRPEHTALSRGTLSTIPSPLRPCYEKPQHRERSQQS
jgi:hypothetical protein